MKFFSYFLFIYITVLFSETKGNFINEVRDKFGNSDKSYSVKLKSINKDSQKQSSEKKPKNHKKK